jgi:ATP-dependent DNA ligase
LPLDKSWGQRHTVPSHKAYEPPSAGEWLHEIKHYGFRVIACKESKRVRLYSRPDNNLTCPFG